MARSRILRGGKLFGHLVVALCFAQSTVRSEVAPPEPRVVVGSLPNAPEQRPMKVRLEDPVTVPRKDMNALVLEAVRAMPSGGTYRANETAIVALRRSIQTADSGLALNATRATPNFCSAATYLVFLSALDQLNRDGRLPLDNNVVEALLVQEHQADGAGIWGRWNANGPGTARLFREADLGKNFTSFDEARAGDFMKIFWNDEIGSRESGHSVIFLAKTARPEGEFVQFWSSNQPDGFGVKEVPRQKIRRQLFSRLEHPENISRLASLPAQDAYLAAMLKRPSAASEVLRMVGAADTGEFVTPGAAGETQPKRNWLGRLFKK